MISNAMSLAAAKDRAQRHADFFQRPHYVVATGVGPQVVREKPVDVSSILHTAHPQPREAA